jgi:hypothetical protein
MSCHECGYSFKLDPIFSAGQPLESQTENRAAEFYLNNIDQDLQNRAGTYSKSSMKEVLRESQERQRTRSKNARDKRSSIAPDNLARERTGNGFETWSESKGDKNYKHFFISIGVVILLISFFSMRGNFSTDPDISSSGSTPSIVETVPNLISTADGYGDLYRGNGAIWNFTVGVGMLTWNGDCETSDQVNWTCDTAEAAVELEGYQKSCIESGESTSNAVSRDITDGTGTLVATAYPVAAKFLYLPIETAVLNAEVPVCALHMQAQIIKSIDTPITVSAGAYSQTWRFEPNAIPQGVVLDESTKFADAVFKFFPNPYLKGNNNKSAQGFKVTSNALPKASESPSAIASQQAFDYGTHMQVGMCQNQPDTGPSLLIEHQAPCSSEHDLEVFHVVKTSELPSDTNSWIREVETECLSQFEGFIGKAHSESSLYVTYSYWNLEGITSPSDLAGVCFVGYSYQKSPAGTLAGSGL